MKLKIKIVNKRRFVMSISFFMVIVIGMFLLPIGKSSKTGQKSEDNNSNLEEQQEQQLDMLLKSMTLEEKVGQMFLGRVPKSNQLEDISSYHLGGYLLFARDFEEETPDTIKVKIENYQKQAIIPMFVAVDEEGGSVSRLKYGDELINNEFLSPQQLYDIDGIKAIKEDAINKSLVLKKYGINYNLAPVADVATDPECFIFSRTLGQGADETSEYVSVVVSAMRENKIGSCLKHFPGYGENADSHEGIIYDTRPLEQFKDSDLKPFYAGIKAGADSILLTHNIVECLDPEYPVSLSLPVHNYLRKTMQFDGVIITDDFTMKGLADFINQNDGAVASINAGSDIIISSSYQSQIPYVIEAIKNGAVLEDNINQSVRRILKMKIDLDIID